VEAIAQTMSLELQEFGIEVAIVNPGPFLTGFNDRGFDTWASWEHCTLLPAMVCELCNVLAHSYNNETSDIH
jgi:NAD(P)-dependent dehydrogenase (short-subunit alcohol dehydrogenase family)